jgi:hypothetical protein
VNLTVYLPDETGRWAKENDLPVSRMLRDAIEAKRKSRETAAATLGHAGRHEVDVTDEDGREFTVRIHGTQIADCGGVRAYLGLDQDLFVYDGNRGHISYPDTPADLEGLLGLDGYIDAMRALGLRPVIDMGLPQGNASNRKH